MAYYNFLDNPKLQSSDRKAVIDYYLKNYIKGGGNDPQGIRRDQNRTYLQCYIDEEFPPEQRIHVGGRNWNPLDKVAQALIWDHPRVRTAAGMMLKDMKTRMILEEEKKRIKKWRQSSDYKFLNDILPVLSKYPDLIDKICSTYERLLMQTNNTIGCSGTWGSSFNDMVITQTGQGISGTFDHKDGRFSGTLIGDIATGTWTQNDKLASRSSGEFHFTFNENRTAFQGKWKYSTDGKTYWRPNQWDGWRK